MTKSTVKPEPVEITKLGNKVRVRMADSVESLTEDIEVLYQYEEVVFEMNYRAGLTAQIEKDFDTYFEFGIKSMELKEKSRVKEDEIRRLIEKQELPTELENLVLGIADAYEDLMNETMENSLAVADLYEMVLGGDR